MANKTKIKKEYLIYNLLMTCALFGLGFLIAGGSIWFGILITIIIAPCLEWLEEPTHKETVSGWEINTPEKQFQRAKNLTSWLVKIGQIKSNMPTDEEIREGLEKAKNNQKKS